MFEDLIRSLAGQPPLLIYAIVAAGAAIENVFPPVPSDTFALFGAFLAAQGEASPVWIYAAVVVGNASSAILTYGLARRYGRSVFTGTGFGRWLLHPGQLGQIEAFYDRWGRLAIFFSRFIPAVRAVAPVFAGVSGLGFWSMLLPLLGASLIWYGAIVWIGSTAGRNWAQIRDTLAPYNTVLLIAGGLLIGAIGWWWWRSREHRDPGADREQG